MIRKPISTIEAIDVDRLVIDKAPESHLLDYKQSLPHEHPKNILDFLADVVAFANASGGDLIFGIEEEIIDGKNTGIPKGYSKLNTRNFDDAVLRLEGFIRTGIEPTLAIQTKLVNGLPEGPVLILRVPASPVAPHMITKYTKDELRPQFYQRHNGGNHPMDIDEIRAAFRTSEGRYERLRKFREERVGIVASDSDTLPKFVSNQAKAVAHLLPVAAFEVMRTYPIDKIPNISNTIIPNPPEWQNSFNFDGYRAIRYRRYDRTPSEYFGVFRNGAVEAVWCISDKKSFPNTFEAETIIRVEMLIEIIAALGVLPPLFIALSLIGVKDYDIPPPPHSNESHTWDKIDRDILQLPECFLGGTGDSAETTLKFAFDALYQAGGYPRSLSYDNEGNWIGISYKKSSS